MFRRIYIVFFLLFFSYPAKTKDLGEKLKKMAHEKYIKRGNKVFGPYLYENYRENGITKTRYLGTGEKKKKASKNLLIALGILFLLVLSLIIITYNKTAVQEKGAGLLGKLETISPINFLIKLFTTSSPINVFVKIISNNPPEILNLSEEILVCENRYVSEYFNVSDLDKDSLQLSYTPYAEIYLFFQPPSPIPSGNILTQVRLLSETLFKGDVNRNRTDNQGWATYQKNIIVSDGREADSAYLNITIIEVNNAPVFDIGVQTIWTKGKQNVFYYDLGKILQDNREETPTTNLTFNLTYFNGSISPFNISKLGIINIIGNESYIKAGENSTTYDLKLCVNDTGLVNEVGLSRIIHQNISICGIYRYGSEPRSHCDSFILTVTKENRAPIITSYYPLNLSFSVDGNMVLYFNLTARDPDLNPVDVYWYVNSIQEKKYEALYENNLSEFEYFFGCEVSGNHIIKVVVTDGLLNASVQWNLTVNYVKCPAPIIGGGGGGGAGRLYCEEKWGCYEWRQCENLNKLVEEGWTSKETELLIRERCKVLNYAGDFCGFQTRICIDYNYCKTEFKKPPFIKECYYTENPNCTDGIRNCHDGSCEVLVDCGGSCVACPTCNDKIQNQGEERIDCGGPCKPCVELPFKPTLFKSIVTYSLIALFILVLSLVIKQGVNYYKSKKREEKEGIKKIIKEGKKKPEKTFFYRLLFIIFVVLLLFLANVYITQVTQFDSIATGVSKLREGFLASYGFINSFFRNFLMLNTLPVFTIPSGTTILGYEDILLEYDFRNNVTDPDPGDNLTIQIEKINDQTNFQDYPWISLTPEGVLRINSTNDSETGNFKLSMKVLDSSNEGQVMSFYFNITLVNDAPIFLNLENKTLLEGDLFEYVINVSDEENNIPFKFNISFVSCSVSDCDLFKNNYTFDEINGTINISFTPTNADIGSYIINFSVMDNSSLGNKTTSVLANFTVVYPLWNSTAQLNYTLTEDNSSFINLTSSLLGIYQGEATFSYKLLNSEFPSFNPTTFNLVTGIINITPVDKDVGYNKVEITASWNGVYSPKIFNFSVLNVNDAPNIQPFDYGNAYENMLKQLSLFVKDDDFLIPQKNFYNENLTLNLTIEGPNSTLFNFVYNGLILPMYFAEYIASFTPRNESIGSYNITLNITDKSNASDFLRFNLTVKPFAYDSPVINYPQDIEFNLKENVTSDLTFRASHSVGDNLTYKFYVNDVLKKSFNYFGNNRNLTWQFTPNFTEETYDNEKKNLTLIVSNIYFNSSRTWNLTINHTNAPPQLIMDIGDKSTTYNDRIEIDLSVHFTDIDYYDVHYNQSFIFNLSSNITENSSSNIMWIAVNNSWKKILLPINQRYTKEVLNISMCDLNDTEIMSCGFSNNFEVEFKEPQVQIVTVPTSGSSTTVPIALKIIMPGYVSAYESEIIRIPIQLVNSGQITFNDLDLSSFAFKNGSIFNEISTSLDKYYFKTLEPGQKENLTLTLFFNTSRAGNYEALINATSKSPAYTDWGKIHINLQKINDSQVRELIIFMQEFIVKNPECIEIQEVVKEAEKLFEQGDYVNARIKAEQAIDACKDAISQVSIPKKKARPFETSLYLALAILLAFVLGLLYYFLKRRKLQKIKIQEIK